MSENNQNVLNCCTKERSCNYTKEEICTLQRLIDKYKNILMCKKTDGASSKQKDHAWGCIENEFNAVHSTKRTKQQLKYKFENLKRVAKKEASKERQEIIKTGGGKPPALPPASEDATDWLSSIMSGSIHGNESVYDDDVLPTHRPASPKRNQEIIIEILPEDLNETPYAIKKRKLDSNENINIMKSYSSQNDLDEIQPTQKNPDELTEEANIENEAFDWSTPHTSLRKPTAAPLRRKIFKKQEDSIIKKTLKKKKLAVIDDLHALELEKIKQAIKHNQELHDQVMKHNQERQDLELEKIRLELEILQKKKEDI